MNKGDALCGVMSECHESEHLEGLLLELVNTRLNMFFSREARTNSIFMSAVPAQLQSALLHFIAAELIILTSGAFTAGQEASMISKSTQPVPF